MKLQAALQSLADSPTAVLDKRHRGMLGLPMCWKDMKEKCLGLGNKLVFWADTSRVASVGSCQTVIGGGVGGDGIGAVKDVAWRERPLRCF